MIAKVILLGVLTVTSYRPVADQTKPECTGRFHCTTSIDDGVTRYGVAVSQDLLASGRVHYGEVLLVPGYGYRVVNDCMGRVRHQGGKSIPITNAIDLMVLTRNEEKEVGTRKLTIYKMEAN
jgi:3D (Asp-Asp-Asp) domain-containing protein